jgi:hypothetical protein
MRTRSIYPTSLATPTVTAEVKAATAAAARFPRQPGNLRLTLPLALVVILTRLPFLGHGYGSDNDGWRAALAARHLLRTGRYLPSRPPGYPLPEYVHAAMLYLGLGSSVWIGLMSAILSGVSAALFFRLLLPLGRTRAVAGALALSFTPVVYVASLGALDYIWGLTFFLAATSCMLSSRIWLSAVFLGLAAASRPTYALAILPLALLYVGYDLKRLRQPTVWRQLAPLALGSGLIAVTFFVPEFLANPNRATLIHMPNAVPPWWQHVAYSGSVGLFGIIGFVGVACAIVLALINKRRGIPVPTTVDRQLEGWALTVLILYALLFARLPDQPYYLIPALPGLYWLLCRYTPHRMLWVMVALLLASCFVLRIGYDRQGAVALTINGPVVREIQIQDERRCVEAVVKRRLEASPDGLDYVIAGYSKPQLQVEIGAPLSDRMLYSVRPDRDGRLLEDEQPGWQAGPIPDHARLLLLDLAIAQPSAVSSVLKGRTAVLDTYQDCVPHI